jgi:lysophospholipase L1-like esterase
MIRPIKYLALLIVASLGACQFIPPGPSAAVPAQLARFENEIQAFEAQDKKSPPPANGVLFVGSSTFRRWEQIEKDFPGLPVINRGFGGSTMAELNYYTDRIVLPYRPKAIIVYEGTNDVATGQSAEMVFNEMKRFHEKVHAALPGTQIYYLPLIPAPSRVQHIAEMDKANALLRDYVSRHPELHYIDARYVWSDASKMPIDSLYIFDRLHPTREAYEKLIPVIRKALDGGR